MKTLFTLLAAGLFVFTVSAQDKKMSPSKDNKAPMEKKMADKKFWCTQCDYSSGKPGVCPHHKTAVVKEGMYFCNGDETHASATAGKCKDGTLMIRMDESLVKKNQNSMKEMMEKKKMGEKK